MSSKEKRVVSGREDKGGRRQGLGKTRGRVEEKQTGRREVEEGGR